MINQFHDEHDKHHSLFGLISVMTVAKSCGCNVPWVSKCLCNRSCRFFLVKTSLMFHSKLDYCNFLYDNLSRSQIPASNLSRILSHMLWSKLLNRVSFTPILCSLHWLNITECNKCKILSLIYTVSQKKLCHFYFYCNFGKCWSILKILLLLESEGSS